MTDFFRHIKAYDSQSQHASEPMLSVINVLESTTLLGKRLQKKTTGKTWDWLTLIIQSNVFLQQKALRST